MGTIYTTFRCILSKKYITPRDRSMHRGKIEADRIYNLPIRDRRNILEDRVIAEDNSSYIPYLYKKLEKFTIIPKSFEELSIRCEYNRRGTIQSCIETVYDLTGIYIKKCSSYFCRMLRFFRQVSYYRIEVGDKVLGELYYIENDAKITHNVIYQDEGVPSFVVQCRPGSDLVNELVRVIIGCLMPIDYLSALLIDMSQILAERYYEKKMNIVKPREYYYKTISLAIADIESKNYHEFNEIFCRTSKITDRAEAALHTPEYYLYPGQMCYRAICIIDDSVKFAEVYEYIKKL